MKIYISLNRRLKKFISLVIGLIIWTLLSTLVDNNVLLPSPFITFRALLNLLIDRFFWLSIFNSIKNIGLGFLLSILIGIGLAFFVYFLPNLEYFLNLPMEIIKNTPIASLTILLLIWFKSSVLATIIVFLIGLPNIYASSLAGLKSVDSELLDLIQVFNVKFTKSLRYVYYPKVKEFLLPSLLTSSGLAWKAGVSGEVLGMVTRSIGENIYYSKLYLETDMLFAWTIVVILISLAFQNIIKLLIGRVN